MKIKWNLSYSPFYDRIRPKFYKEEKFMTNKALSVVILAAGKGHSYVF